jgi:hypothetical protein
MRRNTTNYQRLSPTPLGIFDNKCPQRPKTEVCRQKASQLNTTGEVVSLFLTKEAWGVVGSGAVHGTPLADVDDQHQQQQLILHTEQQAKIVDPHAVDLIVLLQAAVDICG